MRFGLMLGLVLLVCTTAPAAAGTDRTEPLLAELDRCDPAVAAVTGPPLGVLLGLADGRSANEVKSLLSRPGSCIGYVFAIGRGNDEVVLVGAPLPGDTVGAVLWVDRGWWRFATGDAIATALAMPAPAAPFASLTPIADPDFTRRERMSWSALPLAVRTSPPSAPVSMTATFFERGWSHPRNVTLQFARAND